MTVRELVNELTQSYVDWDKEVSVCIADEPVKSGRWDGYVEYPIDRCSLISPMWHINDQCLLLISKPKRGEV